MRSHQGYLSLLLAISYTLAIVCAQAGHDHAPSATASCDDGHGYPLSHNCGLAHDEHSSQPGSSNHTPENLHDSGHSHCAACQFLAEQPLAPATLDAPASERIVAEIRATVPAVVADVCVLHWHGRAPPSLT